ncbi:MAG: hypothetical protein ACRDWA_14035 [Acidimicrobiia bacterium]
MLRRQVGAAGSRTLWILVLVLHAVSVALVALSSDVEAGLIVAGVAVGKPFGAW